MLTGGAFACAAEGLPRTLELSTAQVKTPRLRLKAPRLRQKTPPALQSTPRAGAKTPQLRQKTRPALRNAGPTKRMPYLSDALTI